MDVNREFISEHQIQRLKREDAAFVSILINIRPELAVWCCWCERCAQIAAASKESLDASAKEMSILVTLIREDYHMYGLAQEADLFWQRH